MQKTKFLDYLHSLLVGIMNLGAVNDLIKDSFMHKYKLLCEILAYS